MSVIAVGCAPKNLGEIRDLQAPEGMVEITLADHPELAQPGGRLAIRADGKGKPILVVRGNGDEFSALSLKCTHLGCTVGFDESAGELACPCHGSRFSLDGGNLKGPAKKPLADYNVKFDGTTISFKVA